MHELKKVKWGVIPITTYRNVLVTREIGGFKVLNIKCLTPEEVDAIIDRSMANSNGSASNLEDNSIFNDTHTS